MRFEVFKRDNFTCQYCSAKPPKVPLEIDHIQPVSKGGKNTKENLITACFDCNRGKSNIELSDIPPTLSEKADRMKLAQKQYSDYKRLLKKQQKIIESEIDEVDSIFINFFEDYCLSSRFRITVKKFIEQLGSESVSDAMEIACDKIYYDHDKALKYFCGICWHRIREA